MAGRAARAGASAWVSPRCSAAGPEASSSRTAMPTASGALRLPGARSAVRRAWPSVRAGPGRDRRAGAGARAPRRAAARAALRSGLVPGARCRRRPTRWSATRRPRRIVEVGSGHSTRFLARAIADRALATTLALHRPRAACGACGACRCAGMETTLQQAPESCFTDLAAGDLLFIDSSHILMPGTDVDWLLNRILPALASGRI